MSVVIRQVDSEETSAGGAGRVAVAEAAISTTRYESGVFVESLIIKCFGRTSGPRRLQQ